MAPLRTLAPRGTLGTLRLRDPSAESLRTPSAQVWGVAFDPQGGRFCTVSDDMSLRLYEQKGAAA